MASDLPPRLSDQQQFILASLALDAELFSERPRFVRARVPYTGRVVELLSIAVAMEFDDDGDRISSPPAAAAEQIDELCAAGDYDMAAVAARFASASKERAPMARDRHVTSSHSSSFSRALDRLQARGLLTAKYGDGRRQDRRVRVSATDAGRRAGEEILRRHRDGRYALEFETIG